MNDFNLLLAMFLLVNLLVALLRVARGSTDADQLLVALLFGTIGVAILLLLAFSEDTLALIDVALVFALLAAITGAVFAQRTWQLEERKDEYS
ncbi:monovalent cation/H+ antiporter complex subunit F [Nitrosomonas sp. Nm166]|uniref:monovalent cation/H+ antiporter complex subunit F n=1 Tax=Nitrosomonas sp. Nm166 TaxID=1881054 RepID=UPI0008E21F7E|nr:monovalent cation/H+ antiporter complex subunit F [Nitrosomonas sp. Nm166]SFE16736.1 multicomponent Na+:H+ antiporter subunit F [Nitrosomonas sp. Nm166]